ncbi:4-diphosphocytidyl-2-C-methyl-D-erythritol kinase [Lactobacillus selangorensis]|uniref:4-diphosphocytidyl-2-C-methyl-D-erythritol kinase n=1 Tax=Lactobacillus selangorensis TaxID=81857 RepID=A0A0R2FR97_9LACO|nr:4-(cytidine 5'-diphospho)-2-C-methyl-D-erythritol kinase [Lactobacillus selangorensis]KRN27907.1 4-diphosphocytidyl-2-C-methyl-D-erythritol kinase [Lactobacillus selangorensis]KRN30622.1 4-diphosphocytidyl-2-C-methyl-D-erythritol kinase [Lactobacillus selangorensis]
MERIEKAPAKINLSLDALFRHSDDGRHEWEMVMTSVDLADYVHLKLTAAPAIEVRTDSGFLPEDQRNLAYQAARTLQKKFNIAGGVQIAITKHIPVAAGLGGGSADAAAVLRGLNQLWHLDLSLAELAEIGLTIDSDVPYCVYSRTALVTGKGDQIRPLGELPPFWVVLAKPRISVSTPSVLNHLSYRDLNQHPDTRAVIAGIKAHSFDQMCAGMGNVLEEVTARRYPEITHLKRQMLKFGADAAQMSGSGPTVFGLCRKYSRAQHICNSLHGFCKEVYLVQPCELNKKAS